MLTEPCEQSVCVLCGRPWVPEVKNRCECGGFCTWGKAVGADPDSWVKTEAGYRPRMPSEDLPGELPGRVVTCDLCGKTFPCGWSKEQAVAEMERDFGKVPESERAVVCDDCYNIIRPPQAGRN